MRSLLIVTLLSAPLLLTSCTDDISAAAAPAAMTLPADVKEIAKAHAEVVTTKPEVASFIEATGELVSPMRSQVAPKIGGRISAVYANEGDRVVAGQPLAALETDYTRLDLQRAEADLARAIALENDAQRDLARKRELLATEAVSKVAFDRVETNYESATAARRSASASVATARQRMTDSTLRAPFDGAIESRTVDLGERVADNTPTFVIVQTSTLKVRFRLPEQYLSQVREGQKMKAQVDAYATPFAGRITMIGGVIDPSTRTLVAEAEIANPDGKLRPGMFARVQVNN